MSELHVQQIKGFLDRTFSGKINLSDVQDAPAPQRDSTFLTRGLAALAIMHLADVDAETAAQAVTDGTNDNGIDAVFFDKQEKMLLVVQSKWHGDGRGSIERGDAQKFITGLRDLINTRYDRFNDRFLGKRAEVDAAVYDAQTRIMLALVHSGQDGLASEVQRDFDDLLKEMNDPTDIIIFKVLSQVAVHGVIARGVRGVPIDLEVGLYEWGQVKEPYQAVYGYVAAPDVASWWNSHYPRLFAPNIRMFLGQTDVNTGLLETIKGDPELFWYYNNGITALCAKLTKKPVGGMSHEMGLFECKGVSIVNGAQTVGAIAAAAGAQPDNLKRVKVLIRFISLENTPPDLGPHITQFTNTQNRIERRDFVALDPEQERLRTELQIDGIQYVYKSGDTVPSGRPGFDLAEAAVALACSTADVTLAVQTKREIGRLWEDINKAPYKLLFNSSVNGAKLWHLVQLLRVIEATLVVHQKTRSGRNKLFAVHGNRFVEWMTLQKVQAASPIDEAQVKSVTISALDAVTQKANELYPDVYLASLFKNLTKCKTIANEIKTTGLV